MLWWSFLPKHSKMSVSYSRSGISEIKKTTNTKYYGNSITTNVLRATCCEEKSLYLGTTPLSPKATEVAGGEHKDRVGNQANYLVHTIQTTMFLDCEHKPIQCECILGVPSPHNAFSMQVQSSEVIPDLQTTAPRFRQQGIPNYDSSLAAGSMKGRTTLVQAVFTTHGLLDHKNWVWLFWLILKVMFTCLPSIPQWIIIQ